MAQNILDDFSNLKRTWNIRTELPVSFCIHYSSDIFNTTNHDLLDYGVSDRRIVIIDENVYKLYGNRLETYFQILKIELILYVVSVSEETKDWENVNCILQFFEKIGVLRRAEPVIAIGGGVLLDLVGFCSSIYRRGIPYIKVPTTLLAIVDASVGAKVGVNHLGRRNRIGAYYPPIATLLDKKFINTQTTREVVNGLSEIFKLALIKDNELFLLIEENYEQLINEKFQYGAVPVRVINLAISGMIEELGTNLWEKKLDRCVDFGHSFSPIIEMRNLKELCHGEAVALDCLFSSCLSYIKGYITKPILDRIFNTARNLRLLTYHIAFTDISLLNMALADTMKHRDNNQFLPVPISIGNYTILNNITEVEIVDSIKLFKEMNNV
jgi:3-dehydroquinate synthetase